MKYKPLPIGIENFEDMIKNGYYYVDKTLFIKEIIDKKGKINLFTRPRRFGKSLNLSMVQHYFDITLKGKSHIFNGLDIMSAGEDYTSEMNKYPVIHISLKGAGSSNFETSFRVMKDGLLYELDRHRYLLDSDKISEKDKQTFNHLYDLLNEKCDSGDFIGYLKYLSTCLERHFGEKVIVLIDEYDVPLEKAYFYNYYDEMVDFIRAFFHEGLKPNNSLHVAVVTGCLRVSKESIFTGFNNPNIVTILTSQYGEYFGFTEEEVCAAFKYYCLEDKINIAHDWYNGYIFGDVNVYNPWSIIKFLYDLLGNKDWFPRAYWANTSSNDIIQELVEQSDTLAKSEMEALIRGEAITKPINEEIVYNDVKKDMDSLWNFLFFTGYLRKERTEQIGSKIYLTMKIPNIEVKSVYENKIYEWFNDKIKAIDKNPIYEAIVGSDAQSFENELCSLLGMTISYFDSHESFYHGFVLGILAQMKEYAVKSNRETGTGRCDVYMIPHDYRKKAAIVMELKVADSINDLEPKCRNALEQIENKGYTHELRDLGYGAFIKYGIAFFRKGCMVMVG